MSTCMFSSVFPFYFLMVLVGRIWWDNKAFHLGWSFLWPECLMKQWHFTEKLHCRCLLLLELQGFSGPTGYMFLLFWFPIPVYFGIDIDTVTSTLTERSFKIAVSLREAQTTWNTSLLRGCSLGLSCSLSFLATLFSRRSLGRRDCVTNQNNSSVGG